MRWLVSGRARRISSTACIAGRGFKVRREDMRLLLQVTDGKVFTIATMHLLVDQTRIRECRSRDASVL